MQDTTNLATQFGEIIEPTPVPFSFDAPGWYALFATLILLLIVAVGHAIERYKFNKYRRDALEWIKKQESNTGINPDDLVYEANLLLKRIALRFTNRKEFASLTGTEWIHFLNQNYKGARFDSSDQELVQQVVYGMQKPDAVSVRSHLDKIKRWIKHHKAE